MTMSPAESELEQLLQARGFLTATMKRDVKAPSLQGKQKGSYIVLPDILAVDWLGRGWCFEVKSERESKTRMKFLEMPMGYTGPVWYLQRYKARSYLEFSKAFRCPVVIVIKGDLKWKAGFFTKVDHTSGEVVFNNALVAPGWKDARGIPVLFNVMPSVDEFLEKLEETRRKYWSE
jgi:Holliday junction resolvase